jgi:hypothetical protein
MWYTGRGQDPGGTRIPASNHSRMASAVHEWQLLSEEAKNEWRRIAELWGMWRGYNLFLKLWLRGEI